MEKFKKMIISEEIAATTEDKVKVMQAWANGEPVEFKEHGTGYWEDVVDPIWNWQHFEYRIKKYSEYRPFANVQEFYDAYVIHGRMLVLNSKTYYQILSADDNGVVLYTEEHGFCRLSYDDILEIMKFPDMTPCGVRNVSENEYDTSSHE